MMMSASPEQLVPHIRKAAQALVADGHAAPFWLTFRAERARDFATACRLIGQAFVLDPQATCPAKNWYCSHHRLQPGKEFPSE